LTFPSKHIKSGGTKDTPVHDTPFSLLPLNLFDLVDFFLSFAGYLFTSTFSFQFWIIARFPAMSGSESLHSSNQQAPGGSVRRIL